MPQPPKVLWTFHGSALVRDYDAALAQLGRLVGCRPLEFSDSTDPLIARKGGMTWIGDNSIELVEPTVPDGGPARMLARNGPGVFCLALQVADVAGTAAWFDDLGVTWVGHVKAEVPVHPPPGHGRHLPGVGPDRPLGVGAAPRRQDPARARASR